MSNGSKTTPARSASSFSFSVFRIVAMTFHPRAENNLAAARPRPHAMPVMKTALRVIDRSLSLPSRGQRDHRRSLTARAANSRLAPAQPPLPLSPRPVAALHATNVARRDRYVQHIFTIEAMLVEYRYGATAPTLLRGGWRGATLRTRGRAAACGPTRSVPPDPGPGEGDRIPTLRSPSPRCPPQRGGEGLAGRRPSYPSAGKRGDDPRPARGPRARPGAAGGVPGERVVARRRSRLIPAVPPGATRG